MHSQIQEGRRGKFRSAASQSRKYLQTPESKPQAFTDLCNCVRGAKQQIRTTQPRDPRSSVQAEPLKSEAESWGQIRELLDLFSAQIYATQQRKPS